MADPTVQCPHCREEFALTQSLAAPLLEAAKAEHERQLAEQRRQVAEREAALQQEKSELARSREALADEVEAKVKAQREGIREDEQRKARLAAAAEVETTNRELSELQELLKQRDSRITELQKGEAELRRNQRELEEARAALELTVEKRLEQDRAAIEEKARLRAEAEARRQQRELTEQLEEKSQALLDAEAAGKRHEAALAAAKQAEAELRQKQRAFEEQKRQLEASIDERVQAGLSDKLQAERAAIAEQEKKKAEATVTAAVAEKTRELAEAQEVMKRQDEKLAQAQKAEVELRRKQRELDEQKREMELTIEKRVQEDAAAIERKARQRAAEESQLKMAEKDKLLADTQRQLAEAKQRMEQGSQQLQGEVQELELEAMLRRKFLQDLFEPVVTGERGADLLQRIIGSGGQRCGGILWESKNTKHWNDQWLPKLRADQRVAKADVAVIVSQALPNDLETFDQVDGVWITSYRCVIPVALALRHALVELAGARTAGEGQQTKMGLLYDYLTGPRFRQRVQAIVENFTAMQDDLNRERRTMMRLWAKREEQIRTVIDATAGMYGDMQGIAGQSLREIEGLDMQLIAAGDEAND